MPLHLRAQLCPSDTCRYFYNGIQVTLWLQQWTTSTLGGYAAAVVGLVLLGALLAPVAPKGIPCINDSCICAPLHMWPFSSPPTHVALSLPSHRCAPRGPGQLQDRLHGRCQSTATVCRSAGGVFGQVGSGSTKCRGTGRSSRSSTSGSVKFLANYFYSCQVVILMRLSSLVHGISLAKQAQATPC